MQAGRLDELARRWVDRSLLALAVAIAFLLGCYELGDTDVWWHLRAGQWALENGRVPTTDPFTFGSEGKPWVDVHWSYQLVLALAYRAGGAGALVLLGAAAGCAAFAAALWARRRAWPVVVVVLCWLPALVLLGFRLDPRPEIFSLFYIGCFLAILSRLDERPRLAWLLPVVQVFWVNAQGLFVFGPVLVGTFVATRAAGQWWRGRTGATPASWTWWKHVGGASLAVLLACLCNPYFLEGASFPLLLLPKVAQEGNPYKGYVDELMSAREYVVRWTAAVASRNWFFLALYFLLLALPVSFLYPALWRAWRAGRPTRRGKAQPPPGPAVGAWLGALASVISLLTINTLTLPGHQPTWVVTAGRAMPVVLAVGGIAAALALRRRSAEAAALAAVGAAAVAAWMAWLETLLLAGAAPPQEAGLAVAALGIAAAVLALRRGADLFALALAVAFGYLGLQALQNESRFALVAGTVLAWNFGAWALELSGTWHDSRASRAAGWCLRVGLAAGLGTWLVALATDQYYRHTGLSRHLGLREEPLAFAHDAVEFAGQPGMPQRALVYGLGQTGVYVFHNAPRCKPYMDGRLEMPDRQTFETYVRIERQLGDGDRDWEKGVHALGNPLLLLEHQNNFGIDEASVLTRPGWRCVYFDALASVFVPRGPDVASTYVSVDFAERHFRRPLARSIPDVAGAAGRELKALFNLAAAIPRSEEVQSPELGWRYRVPVLLCALDRAALALEEGSTNAETWALLGSCYRSLVPGPPDRPPTLAGPWGLERGIWWAQAAWCYHRATEVRPDFAPAWRLLCQSCGPRGMRDTEVAAAQRWLALAPRVPPEERRATEDLQSAVEYGRQKVGADRLAQVSPGQLPVALDALLRAGLTDAAAELVSAAEAQGRTEWDWAMSDRAAGLYMHLGRPEDARRLWQRAKAPAAPGLREARLASTFWAQRDFDTALRHFLAARVAAPQLVEASWGLAMLYAQLGRANDSLHACREGLRAPLSEQQRADLEGLQRLLAPYEQTGRGP